MSQRPCKCGKTHTYRDELAAKLALATIQARDNPRRPKCEQAVYRCRFGRVHLTSQKRAKARSLA